MAYSEKVIDHYEKPRNVGSLDSRDDSVGSLATEWVKGKSIDDAYKIENTEIVEELALPPVKIHCSVLAEDAIKAAIEDFRKKNEFY
jgi:nitrogen fixation NifU-like protein